MKHLLIILCLFIGTEIYSQSLFMEVEGNYTGKNLYIQNPYLEATGKFCTHRVAVNSIILDSGLNKSAFEIELDTMNFKLGDSVLIRFEHASNCTPKIITETTHPKPTFEVEEISIDTNGFLRWTAKNEMGKLTYQVEQYVWNKWLTVAEVDGKGGSGINSYECKVTFHYGENKFRVKQVVTGKPRISKTVSIQIKLPEATFKVSAAEIQFSREVMYEIYDSYGGKLKFGTGEKVDISDLKKGAYYLHYDGKDAEFVKKK